MCLLNSCYQISYVKFVCHNYVPHVHQKPKECVCHSYMPHASQEPKKNTFDWLTHRYLEGQNDPKARYLCLFFPRGGISVGGKSIYSDDHVVGTNTKLPWYMVHDLGTWSSACSHSLVVFHPGCLWLEQESCIYKTWQQTKAILKLLQTCVYEDTQRWRVDTVWNSFNNLFYTLQCWLG